MNRFRRIFSNRALIAALAVLALPALAMAQDAAPAAPTLAELSEKFKASTTVANTIWTLIAGMLVFFMNLGFCTLETGLCRRKNAVNILAKNFIVFGISSIAFWFAGFAMMFGGAKGADGTVAASKYIGLTGFMPNLTGDGSALTHSMLCGPVNIPYRWKMPDELG